MNIPLLIAIKKQNLRQFQLSKKTKIHESRLSRIINETSSNPPTELEKVQIATVLKTQVSEIFPNQNYEVKK